MPKMSQFSGCREPKCPPDVSGRQGPAAAAAADGGALPRRAWGIGWGCRQLLSRMTDGSGGEEGSACRQPEPLLLLVLVLLMVLLVVVLLVVLLIVLLLLVVLLVMTSATSADITGEPVSSTIP